MDHAHIHSSSALLTRRALFKGTACAGALLCLGLSPFTLSACSSETMPQYVTTEPLDDPFSPDAFNVAAALGAPYDEALHKVQELAEDAVLLGIRSSTTVLEGETVHWDYLFGSPEKLKYFIVFTGNSVTAAELGDVNMLGTEWRSVPPVTDISIDAPEAYEKACAQAEADGRSEAHTLYAYLQTYISEGDAGDAYVYDEQPLTWYFEFNYDEERLLAQNSALGEDGATPEQADDTSDAEDQAADSTDDDGNAGTAPPYDPSAAYTTMFVYAVNAVTGETTEVPVDLTRIPGNTQSGTAE